MVRSKVLFIYYYYLLLLIAVILQLKNSSDTLTRSNYLVKDS